MWIEDTVREQPEKYLHNAIWMDMNGKQLLCSTLDAAAGRSRVRWFLAAIVRNCWDRLSQLCKDIVPAMLMKVVFWCVLILDGSAFLHHLFCSCGRFCSSSSSLLRICCCFNCLVEVCRAEGWNGIESGSRALLRQGTFVARIVG